jgi:hypothetical protein
VLSKNVGIKKDESDLEIFRMTRHLKDSF